MMRKITQRIRDAFYDHKKLSITNTITDGESVWLFGNKIIERRYRDVYFTLAGWNTNTTRERLNGILDIRVYVVKGQAYVRDKNIDISIPINSKDWICISPNDLYVSNE